MRLTASSLEDCVSLAARMASNPADAATLAAELAETIDALPPPRAALLSRYRFERAGLWSLVASFENVTAEPEAPPQIIECPHDVWIRGVNAVAIPHLALDVPQMFGIELLPNIALRSPNGRPFFDANWRLDQQQGFISSGKGELLAPGVEITGDGCHPAPLDWRLQKGQTIDVRLRSRIQDFVTTDFTPEQADALFLRWVTIVFWAEDLNQPSARR